MKLFTYSNDNTTSKNITLKVNSDLYDKYRQLCKYEDLDSIILVWDVYGSRVKEEEWVIKWLKKIHFLMILL